MFTGIVEACVPITSFESMGEGARLVLPSPSLAEPWTVARGDSIAVSGCCLTVAEMLDPADGRPLPDGSEGAAMVFDLSSETLARTWLGRARAGHRVNVERALCFGDRLGGHMVSGHVDGLGKIVEIHDTGDGGRRFTFELDAGLERHVIDKGSVTLDGISLTVCDLRERRFDVAVIPVTLEVTHLGEASVGDPIHVETDLVGKWIDRLTQTGAEARS